MGYKENLIKKKKRLKFENNLIRIVIFVVAVLIIYFLFKVNMVANAIIAIIVTSSAFVLLYTIYCMIKLFCCIKKRIIEE